MKNRKIILAVLAGSLFMQSSAISFLPASFNWQNFKHIFTFKRVATGMAMLGLCIFAYKIFNAFTYTPPGPEQTTEPDGSPLIVCGQFDGNIVIRNSGDGRAIQIIRTSEHVPALYDQVYHPVVSLAASPDGRTIASIHRGEDMTKIWDRETGQLVQTLAHPHFTLNYPGRNFPLYHRELLFSPDGSLLVVASPNRITVWNTQTWQELASKAYDDYAARPVENLTASFGSDGKTIYVYTGNEIEQLHTETLIPVRHMEMPSELELARLRGWFSHDSKYFAIEASLGTSQGVAVLNTETKQIKQFFAGFPLQSQVTFSHDNKLIALRYRGKQNYKVKVFDMQTGQMLQFCNFGNHRYRSVYEAPSFSPDGMCITSVAANGNIRTYNLKTGTRLPYAKRKGRFIGVETITVRRDTVATFIPDPDPQQIIHENEEERLQFLTEWMEAAEPEEEGEVPARKTVVKVPRSLLV